MRSLIVDDDFICRKVLLKFLSDYGECDVAVNGKEAIDAFRYAFENNEKYDLICLDIMMPELDGQETLREIRSFEQEKGVFGLDYTKVLMTTALDDPENIKKAFRGHCEGYLVKPIKKEELEEKLKGLELTK